MNAITDLFLFRARPKRSMPVGTHALAVSTMLAWQPVSLLGGPLVLPRPATHVIVHSYWPSLPGASSV